MNIVDFQLLDGFGFAASRVPACVLALFFSALGGFWLRDALPSYWRMAGRVLAPVARKLDRPHRSDGELFFRGSIVCFLAIALALLVAEVFRFAIDAFPFRSLAAGALLSLLLSVSAPWRLTAQLRAELKDTAPALARRALADVTGLNTAELDIYGASRLAIAQSVRLLDRALAGPVFWYLLGGWPMALVQATLAALTWRYGWAPGGGAFVVFVRRCDFVLAALPSFLLSLALSAAALVVPGASIGRVLVFWAGGWRRPGGSAPFAQGGLPLSVTAWMLGLTLGGPFRNHAGQSAPGAWIGPPQDSAKVEPFHLKRMIYLGICTNLIVLLAVMGFYVAAGAGS